MQDLFLKHAVRFIHGQEPPKEIEQKMGDFVSGKTDILVCTSIIESGIDVSSANCIIINNAHLFGLSQLYQMRGRVGRGHLQAYAYLLVPRGRSLSDRAYKRIKFCEITSEYFPCDFDFFFSHSLLHYFPHSSWSHFHCDHFV